MSVKAHGIQSKKGIVKLLANPESKTAKRRANKQAHMSGTMKFRKF
jgi:hypothetical protein